MINKGSKVTVTSRIIDGRSTSVSNYNFDFSNLNKTSDNILVEGLIKEMIKRKPEDRLTANQVLKHPYFWKLPTILAFVTDISNRLELKDDLARSIQSNLEINSQIVTKGDWLNYIDKAVLYDLERKRKYSGTKVCDLLRAIRNKVKFKRG